MVNSLIECIPNFSDAVRPEIIQEIVKTIQQTGSIRVLDLHSDMDHNRSVVTFVGCPDDVEKAAFLAIQKAAQLIDLNLHHGEHPRIGATDVVPFVPIQNVSMEECIQIARRLAKRVADELGIPVYLYEEAALIPDRTNLENIRRGQYEGLKEAIRTDLSRKPDFGPCELGTAGATVIGARQPLIAYNVYLTTDNVKIAQMIAKTVRHSSGGFRYVKAMGILVEGRAQVSMNLTNFKQTPIHRVIEVIRREANRYGVDVHHCELVGLIPQEAMLNSAEWYLQLDGFHLDQVLEQKLFSSQPSGSLAAQPKDFLDELAAPTPTPGGGAAAAHTGAAAAALISMVSRLTIGKKKYVSVEAEMGSILEKSEKLRNELSKAVDKDSTAFNQFMNALQLPKDTIEQIELRNKALETSSIEAARVPFEVAQKTFELIKMANIVAAKGNINAISDAGSSAAFCKAAFVSACLNVRINLVNLKENKTALSFLEDLRVLENEFVFQEKELLLTLKQRSQLEIQSL